jgi:hypothetical protein
VKFRLVFLRFAFARDSDRDVVRDRFRALLGVFDHLRHGRLLIFGDVEDVVAGDIDIRAALGPKIFVRLQAAAPGLLQACRSDTIPASSTPAVQMTVAVASRKILSFRL